MDLMLLVESLWTIIWILFETIRLFVMIMNGEKIWMVLMKYLFPDVDTEAIHRSFQFPESIVP